MLCLADTHQVAGPMMTGPARILVVDDEPQLLDMIAAFS
jgi:hypothetical protein